MRQKKTRIAAAVTVGSIFLCLPLSASSNDSTDFRPLFNGEDLSGWIDVNVAPETFTVRDGVIFCTGKPTGVMRTERQYENFILELEWKHLDAGGNAGLFVWSDPLPARGQPFTRAMEVQILDGHNSENYTSHGDVFAIHGARFTPNRPHPNGWMRSLPSERRCRPAGHWNHYRVTCRDGNISLAVNGKTVSGGHDASPRKGYICLEAEGSEILFRNIRIKTLPATHPKPNEIADVAQGFKTLYNGLNLDGWKGDTEETSRWEAQNWTLTASSTDGDSRSVIWTETEYRDFELICDWRWTGDANGSSSPNGSSQAPSHEAGIILRDSQKADIALRSGPDGSGAIQGYANDESLPASIRTATQPRTKADRSIGNWNRMQISLRDRTISITLNDQELSQNATLPKLPQSGPLGLQITKGNIEFANLFVRER